MTYAVYAAITTMATSNTACCAVLMLLLPAPVVDRPLVAGEVRGLRPVDHVDLNEPGEVARVGVGLLGTVEWSDEEDPPLTVVTERPGAERSAVSHRPAIAVKMRGRGPVDVVLTDLVAEPDGSDDQDVAPLRHDPALVVAHRGP